VGLPRTQSLGPFAAMLAKVRQQYASLLTPPLNFKVPAPGEPPILNRSLTWYAADHGESSGIQRVHATACVCGRGGAPSCASRCWRGGRRSCLRSSCQVYHACITCCTHNAYRPRRETCAHGHGKKHVHTATARNMCTRRPTTPPFCCPAPLLPCLLERLWLSPAAS